ncbi:MAG TPA: hypothetical protein VL068_02430 [Microthrixaceae bacterium]|nr:hypothetical protein [Microthrixaceae bacterium]
MPTKSGDLRRPTSYSGGVSGLFGSGAGGNRARQLRMRKVHRSMRRRLIRLHIRDGVGKVFSAINIFNFK